MITEDGKVICVQNEEEFKAILHQLIDDARFDYRGKRTVRVIFDVTVNELPEFRVEYATSVPCSVEGLA